MTWQVYNNDARLSLMSLTSNTMNSVEKIGVPKITSRIYLNSFSNIILLWLDLNLFFYFYIYNELLLFIQMFAISISENNLFS
jgi:hypothetical protein